MAEARPRTGVEGKGAAANRPLSPHLQIYKPVVNMVMSILHRITGAALYFGSLLLVWWLVAAAVGPAYFDYVNGLFATLCGKLLLVGYTWTLIHHALGGVRHFVWDTGRGFDLETVDRMSWLTLLGSALITAVIWIYVIGQRGGF
jgi:succinate dehydrogenase / fumarate reductase cytochrome b subunit